MKSQFENNPFFNSYSNRGPNSHNNNYGGYPNNYKNDGLGKGLKPVDWKSVKLEDFQQVFYLPSEHESYSREQIEEFKKSQHIYVQTKHTNVPDPMITWEDTKFPQYITQEIRKSKFKEPTIIQSIAFPIVMSGHDFIGIAQTGSGKTLAYLLPGIIHINAQAPIQQGDGPIVLILAPTRELAQQIEEQSAHFGNPCKLNCACIFGGVDRGPQKGALLKGADIVIATPGRLIDFLESGTTNMRRVTYLVLDEADRMLDMGFEPQIRKIVEQIRPDRQTLMFSATWPKEVRNLARDFCHESPLHVQIGNFQHSINQNIEQIFVSVHYQEQPKKLLDFLADLTQDDKVLIFCQTKNGCDDLFNFLKDEKYRAMVIHGDQTQEQRDYVMERFRTGKVRMLIATDVASRGLDVKDITHVINFDFPKQIEDYIHRIGRTGRAGKKGVSISFLLEDEDQRIASDLIDVLEEASQKVPDIVYDIAADQRQKYPPRNGPRPNYGSGGYNNHNGRTSNFNSGNNNNNIAPRPVTANNYPPENKKEDEPPQKLLRDYPEQPDTAPTQKSSRPYTSGGNSYYNNSGGYNNNNSGPHKGGYQNYNNNNNGNNYRGNNNNNTGGGGGAPGGYQGYNKGPQNYNNNNNNNSNYNHNNNNNYSAQAPSAPGGGSTSSEAPQIPIFYNSKKSQNPAPNSGSGN